MRLNLGCGSSKLKDYINVDKEHSCSPDLQLDFSTTRLPFPDDSQLEVLLFHTIEHIEKRKHRFIFEEIWRVLAPDCSVLVTFPEFSRCAQNYLSNYRGQKEFWEATIFGRQLYPSDYHVCAVDTDYIKDMLTKIGFTGFYCSPEINESWNTVICCIKGQKPMNYERLLADDFERYEIRQLAA
jgi:predicted SAM-dependent methyltransferase